MKKKFLKKLNLCRKSVPSSASGQSPSAGACEVEIVTDDPHNDAQLTTKVYAAGICCQSEVAIIHEMLDTFPGVLEVRWILRQNAKSLPTG